MTRMTDQSAYQQLRQMEQVINRLGQTLDFERSATAGRRAFDGLKRDTRMALDMLKDYEMFQLDEDTRKQAQLLPRVVKALQKMRASMLKASEYDLIGAVDVAQMSAQLDELVDRLH
jgi:phage anti-repressor protein